MEPALDLKRITAGKVAAWLVPVSIFWIVLAFQIPFSFTQYFHRYFPLVFIAILLLFYTSFHLRGDFSIFCALGLTMLSFALALSFLWTSGFSDNFLIGGLLPYKDAKNYYIGASLLLNGLPIRVAGQALGRPLFPGFLSSLLLLTGQNLKIALAMLVQLAGVGVYLSARQVRGAMGALAGALYIAFMIIYFQPFVGYAMSESLGFIGGCFGFTLLWRGAEKRSWFDLIVGLALLMVAVSARAGAFLIFPLLALWAGWAFRGEKRFSLLSIGLVLAVVAAGYFIVNSIYPRLLGVPEGSSFGNFAYTLFGQVRGGIGWHSAIAELGTRNPERVYQAVWEAFQAHPSGLFQGVMNAYGDFFLPGLHSVFPFADGPLNLILWALTILFLLRGLYLLVFRFRSDLATLLLAGFIGILLSIPFLPPVDGGNRFYASTMPFFFAPLALGAGRFRLDGTPASAHKARFALRSVPVALLALTVLLPPATLRVASLPVINAPECSSEQRPFAVRIRSGAYIDLVHDKSASCGLTPRVCLEDFRKFNTEMGIDDFYQALDSLAASSPSIIRVIPTINLLDGYFQYFVTKDSRVLASSSDQLLLGCATRVQTENQRIFVIDSISMTDR